MSFFEKIKEKSVSKNINKTVSMSQDIFDKLTLKSSIKTYQFPHLIEHVLLEQFDRFLMGKNMDINTAF